MRDIDQARTSFQELKRAASVEELKSAVRPNGSHSIAIEGCRSACWKAFLLFDSVDIVDWQRVLSSSRSAYNSIRAHFLRPLEYEDEIGASYDPLSDDSEASPWTQLRKDEELRAEILQDVTRCMPENLFFRQPDTQRMLLDILFVFCKLNPDVSYRQGMHELLAPVLWVVERDAVDPGQSSKLMGDEAAITVVFDAAYIEHDTFALFGQLMQSAKNFYEQTTTSGTENPIVNRSRRIFRELLPRVDERLAKHLDAIDIVPQVFLMRWIRLLFGREFSFDQTLGMWDVIFAEDPALEVVDEISVIMLLRIRWELLDADYNEALALLLRYPEIDPDFSAQNFVVDALYLRQHMDYHGGSFLVSKYTGRPMYQTGRPTTPPVLQRNKTVVSVTTASNKGTKGNRFAAAASARDINQVIQSTAKELYARGEKLGINQVVRNAVDEVQKKAQEIRDAPTPSAPSHRHRPSRSSMGADSLFNRIKTLEERNKGLAKLLDAAITDLWAYQKTITEPAQNTQEAPHESDVEKLSAAIAKAQFVQVYLDDSSLVLPSFTGDEHEPAPRNAASGRGERAPAVENPLKDSLQYGNATTVEGNLPMEQSPDQIPNRSQSQSHDARLPSKPSPGTLGPVENQSVAKTAHVDRLNDQSNTLSTRPRLEQSSFSWMLGDQKASSPMNTKVPSFTSERPRKKGYLFGEEAE